MKQDVYRVRFEIYSLHALHICVVVVGVTTLPWPSMGFFQFVGAYFLLSRIGGDVGFHRYFCHRSFAASKWIENALLALGTIECKGSSLTWCSHHLAHHKHADRWDDPHSPLNLPFYRILWSLWPAFKGDLIQLRRLLTRKHLFLHKFYFLINAGLLLVILVVFGLESFVWFSLPIVYSFYLGGLVNFFGHRLHWSAYRNHETLDKSYNSVILNAISLGGGQHNNHHNLPASPNTQERWFEFDPPGFLIRIARKT